MRSVWLVEDDDILTRELAPQLEDKLQTRVRLIRTEEEFRREYQDLAKTDPPAVTIFDIWLRWTSTSLLSLPPEECRNDQVAGVRCRRLLADLPSTMNVPAVYYSFFSLADVRNLIHGDVFMTKRGTHKGLIEYLRQLLAKANLPGGPVSGVDCGLSGTRPNVVAPLLRPVGRNLA
jgi:hypothetical protein